MFWTVAGTLALCVVAAVFSPFILWRSWWTAARSVVQSTEVTTTEKLRMASHLGREVLFAPLFSALWHLDELVYGTYRSVRLRPPVFIMSQPRSGTTFLLRTLAADSDTFFSLKHLEWRYPFILFWKVIDLFNVRDFFENIDYWPKSDLGRLASKIHHHKLGSVEEHGIFFEERMYHHYFTFRRFPFLDVLDRVSSIESLTKGEKDKLLRTFTRVVQKAAFFKGQEKIWLTKENESADLYRLIHDHFRSGRFITIVRDPEDFVKSYVNMSNTCTTVKHGVDPNKISNWHSANLQFRLDECRKMVELCSELEKNDRIIYVTYRQYTSQILPTVQRLFSFLGLTISHHFYRQLSELQSKQDVRDSGYSNERQDVTIFEDYRRFVALKSTSQN